MRRAAKRDDNEALIVTVLQSAGWTVVRVSDAGAPDLLVARNGVLTLMEVKGPKGTLTDTQKVAFERLAGAGVQVQVVRSPQEALGVVGAPFSGVIAGAKPVGRWVADNGAYICEHCWLPENGLHAKGCPTRTALKPKHKVQSAHRAAKKMAEAMPKRIDLATAGDYVGDTPKSAMPKTCSHEPSWRCGACPPRGVEGELQPLKALCAEEGCGKPVRRSGGRFCDAH